MQRSQRDDVQASTSARPKRKARATAPTSAEARLGVTFRNGQLLDLALSHSSLLNEGTVKESNERLEFLGDALLDMVIALELYTRFSDLPEGELTRLRSYLVKRDTLAVASRGLGLGEFLRMGRGEESTGGRERDSNLSSALEAVVAAVYLDQGYEATRTLTLRALHEPLRRLDTRGAPVDPKVALQERVLAQGSKAPEYRVVNAEGPDHNKSFSIEVVVNGNVLGIGQGHRMVDAEREAARTALATWDRAS